MFNYSRNFGTNFNVNSGTEHLVFEQRTEHDKDISTLANIKADCLLFRAKKICSVSDCAACSKGNKIQACMNQLALCDQLKVDSMAQAIYAHNSYLIKRNRQSSIGCYIIAAVIFVGVGLMSIFCLTR